MIRSLVIPKRVMSFSRQLNAALSSPVRKQDKNSLSWVSHMSVDSGYDKSGIGIVSLDVPVDACL